MFARNENSTDRILRAALGVLLIVGFFTMPDAGLRWALLIGGLIGLGTAAVGFCPLYRIFGISTCQMKR